MEPIITDTNLNPVIVVDLFDSFIWTERFSGVGDFELRLPINFKGLEYIQPNGFVILKESRRVMVIESLTLSIDNESGSFFIVKGRSLESILDRRIIRSQTVLNGSLQTGVQTILNQNAISPTDTNRAITKLRFLSNSDPNITALTMDEQFHGESLLEAINYICKSVFIGFEILMDTNKLFQFRLNAGIDRSFGNFDGNPLILFSPKLDNVASSKLYFSTTEEKTTTLVGGENYGYSRKLYDVDSITGAKTDLDRKELFTNASFISSSVSSGTLTSEQYNALLANKGRLDLSVHRSLSIFDVETEPNLYYEYDVDYSIGDIVQVEDSFGNSSSKRISEYIFSQDGNGEKRYPTFELV